MKIKEIVPADELFISYCNSRDESAFRKLFDQVDSWLFVSVYALLGDRDEANDIIQEAWIKVIEKGNKFDPERGKFTNFIFTIARNLALEKMRRKKMEMKWQSSSEIQNDSSEEDFYQRELGTLLRESVAKLNNKNYQDTIILYYFGELNVKEISIIMHTSETNILNWLKRGRNELEKEIQRNPEYRNFNIAVPNLILMVMGIGVNYV